MRIIEHGTVVQQWKIEHRCTGWGKTEHGCNALLEVEKADLRRSSFTDLTDGEPSVTFKCPCCGALTDLGRVSWPNDYRMLPKFTAAWEHDEETPI